MHIPRLARRIIGWLIPFATIAEFVSLIFRGLSPDWQASHLLTLGDHGFLMLLGLDLMPDSHHRRWTRRLMLVLYPAFFVAACASQVALLMGHPEWTPHLLVAAGVCALAPGMSTGWANVFAEDKLDRVLSGRYVPPKVRGQSPPAFDGPDGD